MFSIYITENIVEDSINKNQTCYSLNVCVIKYAKPYMMVIH